MLQAEHCAFEEEAVNLLARRAAGSVRDGMSLLGQVLALGGGELTALDVREVLGLAGQDLFLQIVQAIVQRDCVLAGQITENLLEQGVDMGFFLRELALLWRNLFMLRQAGEKAFKVLDFSKSEAEVWLNASAKLSLTHIHACWQLTLEGQRRVLDSLEPGQALELLLLNMTVLPDLLPLYAMPDKDPGQDPGQGQSATPHRSGMNQGSDAPRAMPQGQENKPASTPATKPEALNQNFAPGEAAAQTNEAVPANAALPEAAARASQDSARDNSARTSGVFANPASQDPGNTPAKASAGVLESEFTDKQLCEDAIDEAPLHFLAEQMPVGPGPQAEEISQPEAVVTEEPCSQAKENFNLAEWMRFIEFCKAEQALENASSENDEPKPGQNAHAHAGQLEAGQSETDRPESWLNPLLLEKAEAVFSHDCVKLICPSEIAYEHWMKEFNLAGFSQALQKFTGKAVRLELLPPLVKAKTVAELREEAQSHPTVKLLREKMGAQLKDCVLLTDLF